MTTAIQPTGGSGGPGGGGASSSLADVLDTILDKGLVIDAYVRVSLVGIELLTIDARVVIASVDTYLRFAEATNRLDLTGQQEGLPELMNDMQEGGAEKKVKGATRGALESAGDKLQEILGDDEDEDEDDEREPARSRRSRSRDKEE